MNINHFYPEMHTGLTKRPALVHQSIHMVAIKFIEGFTKFMVSLALFEEFSCKDAISPNKSLIWEDTRTNRQW